MRLSQIDDVADKLRLAQALATNEALENEVKRLAGELDRYQRKLKAEKSTSRRLRRRLDNTINTIKEENMITTSKNVVKEEPVNNQTTIKQTASTYDYAATDLFAPYREHAPEPYSVTGDAWRTVDADGQTVVFHSEAPTGGWTGWAAFRDGHGFTVGIDDGDKKKATGHEDIAWYANQADDNGLDEERDWLDDMVNLARYLSLADAKTVGELTEQDAENARARYDEERAEAAKPEPGETYERKMSEQKDKARERRGKAADDRLTGDPVKREALDLMRDIARHLGRIADTLEGEARA